MILNTVCVHISVYVPVGAVIKLQLTMETIKRAVLEVRPNFPQEQLAVLAEKLHADGVETVGDLEYIQAEDLQELRPIDRRKLLQAWDSNKKRGTY